ncbi:hypothetical protein EK21DRAFT_39353, partial [Setomelanomma holmii]
REDYEDLIGCYAVGTTLHDRGFRDAVASKIVVMLQTPGAHQSQLIRLLTPDAIGELIAQYGTKSPLFLLLAAAYARFANDHQISTLAFSTLHGDFKNHVMKELATLRGKHHTDGAGASDFATNGCRFHSHGIYDLCPLRK